MSKRDGCETWDCPDCKYLNHTCRAEDNEHLYVCENCGQEFEYKGGIDDA